MRLVEGLARQLSARLDWSPAGRGTRLTLLFRPLPLR